MRERSILHVDDDQDFLRLVAAKLNKAGYNVISLSDPSRTLEALGESGARIVILDIDMPQCNGIDVLREIKEYDGGVQVIMLSGVVTMLTALESMRVGAEACVFKPITDLQPLLSSVSRTFEKMDQWYESIRELERRRSSELVLQY